MVYTDPIPQDIDEYTLYAIRLEKMSHAELIVELKENALQVMERLELEGEPTQERASFWFNPAEHALYIPDSLLNEFKSVMYSDVQFRTEVDASGHCAISVSLVGNTSTGWDIEIYIAHDASGTTTTVQLGKEYNGTPPLEPCTEADINRLIASAILPNKLGDYAFFDTLDLNDPTIIRNIAESLERHADYSDRLGQYVYNGQPIVFQKSNGRIYEVGFEGNLTDGSQVTITTTYPESQLDAIMSDGFSIEGVEVYANKGKGPELPPLTDDEIKEACLMLRGIQRSDTGQDDELTISFVDLDNIDPEEKSAIQI